MVYGPETEALALAAGKASTKTQRGMRIAALTVRKMRRKRKSSRTPVIRGKTAAPPEAAAEMTEAAAGMTEAAAEMPEAAAASEKPARKKPAQKKTAARKPARKKTPDAPKGDA